MTEWKVGDKVKVLHKAGIMFGNNLLDGNIYNVVDVSDAGRPMIDDGGDHPLVINAGEDMYIAKMAEEEFSATRPAHYHEGGVDVFTFIEANWSKEKVSGFYAGNVIKYVARSDKKNGLEDLEKALVNLKQLIKWEGGHQNG